MNIKITNTSDAKSDAMILLNSADSFESLVSTMRTIKISIQSNWSDCTAKTSAINNLTNSIDYYENKIIPALNKLGTSVDAYALATEQLAASRAAGGGVGVSAVSNTEIAYGSPSEYADGQKLRASSEIVDETAYSNGNNSLDRFKQNVMGSYEERYEVMDEMYQFFKGKGLTDEQIAGILGNAAQESGFVVDAKNPNSSAKGLFQWINSDLYVNGELESNQPSNWSLDTQLEHAWHQIEGKADMQGYTVLERMNAQGVSDSVSASARNFAIFFEGCGDDQYGARGVYADAIYAYIKDNYTNPSSKDWTLY